MTTGKSGAEPGAPNPGLLTQIALAYRASTSLFAASDLGVFTALTGASKTAEEVAAACGGHAAPMRLLLEACVETGLLQSDGARYSNSPTAEFFLVRGQPKYLGESLKYAEDLYPPWGHLADLVRTGKPVIDPDSILGVDKEKTRAFVYAMHERARGIGSVLPHGTDLSGRRRLLDVGGGPGTYSIALVQKHPGLSSTVLDLPGVLEVTREIVDANGVADRITLLPGDYLKTPFGSKYDAALLSGMMHRETEAGCRLLLQKAFAALDPGGVIIVSDVFFDDERKSSPPFATHFALNMMLTSHHGSAHAKTEMVTWMGAAGFVDVQVREAVRPNPHSIVTGTRP